MHFQIIPVPALRDNYIWTLINRDNQSAVCVDPGEAQPVLTALKENQLNLVAILVTHHHWDHTHGIKKLLKHCPVPVYGPQKEAIPTLTHPLKEGDQVEIPELSLSLEVIEIPGHTKGHIAYYAKGILFCGDTLFTGGCGRIFEGTAEQMFNSINKLSKLPLDTLVYCGHEYTQANLKFALAVEPENTAIQERLAYVEKLRDNGKVTVPAKLGVEQATNPFLRSHIPAVKIAAERKSGQKLTTTVDIFATIRQWKNHF